MRLLKSIAALIDGNPPQIRRNRQKPIPMAGVLLAIIPWDGVCRHP
jgi:hypothetical protein